MLSVITFDSSLSLPAPRPPIQAIPGRARFQRSEIQTALGSAGVAHSGLPQPTHLTSVFTSSISRVAGSRRPRSCGTSVERPASVRNCMVPHDSAGDALGSGSDAPASRSSGPNALGCSSEDVRARRGAILVVDDDPVLLRALGRQLRGEGFDVETALDGDEAMRLVRAYAYDVIVSDIAMPNLDGLQLLREVRAHDLHVPVVLITGAPTVASAVGALEYGAFHYLTKPVQNADLRRVVERAVRTHRLLKCNQDAVDALGVRAAVASDRAGLEASLSGAMRTLWVAYQPIVDASTRDVFGYEALLRTREVSLPTPDSVIDAAEQLGLANDLGRAVRKRAAEPFFEVPDRQLLFVNVRPSDLLDPALTATDTTLAKMAHRVVLEITERTSLSIIKDMRNRVARLREIGYRIAVDDLGAGYAGLTSFAQLEPEFVKLDMSLIRDVHQTPVKQKVVGSISRLARDMGMLVVAEGIETPEERDTVVALDCNLLQGFHFARPAPAFPAIRW
jgi:EAL domain-containing protein (putative c-di-GMP-specific phosphodiesterase class I)